MTVLSISIPGIARPKGSKTLCHSKTGRAWMRESCTSLRAWMDDIIAACHKVFTVPPLIDEPVAVRVTAYVPRPKAHFSSNGDLKPSAPALPKTGADLDKCARAVLDALQQAGVLRNDARVSDLSISRRYGDPSTHIEVALL